MALIKCQECGKEFSDKASACPNCACPNCACPIKKQKKSKKPIDKWFIILFILTLILCLVSCYFILYLWEKLIALVLGVVCILIYLLMIFKMKKTKPKIILSLLLGIFLIVCICVSINELSYINEQSTPIFENQNGETEQEEIDNRTPKQRFHDTLLSKGFTTSDNINYTFNYGSHSNEMYSFIDLEEQLYQDYSNYNGLYMLTEYYYGKQIVKFTYKYMGYYGNIEWNLKTKKWTSNSSLNNWNAQKYVDDNMNDLVLDFNELLNQANVSIEDIK